MVHLISDVKVPAHLLEFLTVQHDHIDELLAQVRVDQRREFLDELVAYITAHLAVEQELLFPRLAARISDVVRAELLAEHQEIKRVLADLLWLDNDDPQVAPTLSSLETLFEGHSIWQDEELFESLAETMSPTAIAELNLSVKAGFDQMREADLAA